MIKTFNLIKKLLQTVLKFTNTTVIQSSMQH